MKYKIQMEVLIESDLSQDELRFQLALCLFNTQTENTTIDNTTDDLRVIEYQKINVSKNN